MRSYKNTDNFNFYNKIGIERFLFHAENSGMNECPDMESSWPYIKDSSSILEIGAGYGRCVDYLLKKEYKGKIIALEQSEELLDYLNNHSSAPNVTSVKDDIKNFQENVDCALWMWSGILDFSPKEQQAIISHVYDLLNDGSKLIIETPKLGIKTFADHLATNQLHVDTDFGSLDCYIPSHEEIHTYAEKAGFNVIAEEDYTTSKEKERSIYVLKKS